MVVEQPRGTVTFLFTDIERSTQLVTRLGDRYADVLGDHRRLMRGAFAEHNGWEVDTQGDAFFVAFDRVKDAVLAAAAIQRALAKHAERHRSPSGWSFMQFTLFRRSESTSRRAGATQSSTTPCEPSAWRQTAVDLPGLSSSAEDLDWKGRACH
jgi:Adenylate and Guanylate cyclase catalytic domain